MTCVTIPFISGNTALTMEFSWFTALSGEFQQPYMHALQVFLDRELVAGKVIYPPVECWFNAFNSTPLDKVKVVILGQDPYHGPEQSHGLCFSVRQGVRVPPSLRNIFKELHQELGICVPTHGCLQGWAEQGVLLLNATLTVEQGQAGSHQGKGWEQLTDRAIQVLSTKREGLVFLLWGNSARNKARLIDEKKNLILESPHPSPLSAHRGFFGCNHFVRTNDYLRQQGVAAVDWRVD